MCRNVAFNSLSHTFVPMNLSLMKHNCWALQFLSALSWGLACSPLKLPAEWAAGIRVNLTSAPQCPWPSVLKPPWKLQCTLYFRCRWYVAPSHSLTAIQIDYPWCARVWATCRDSKVGPSPHRRIAGGSQCSGRSRPGITQCGWKVLLGVRRRVWEPGWFTQSSIYSPPWHLEFVRQWQAYKWTEGQWITRSLEYVDILGNL